MRTKTYVMSVEKNSDEVLEQLNKLQNLINKCVNSETAIFKPNGKFLKYKG